MTKTLWVEIGFVTLHETRPADLPDWGGTQLVLSGNFVTDKYREVQGVHNNGWDIDYAEFRIVSATFNPDYA